MMGWYSIHCILYRRVSLCGPIYFIEHCSRVSVITWIRICPHSRHPITRPNRRAMRCQLWGFFLENWPCYDGTALYITSLSYLEYTVGLSGHLHVQSYTPSRSSGKHGGTRCLYHRWQPHVVVLEWPPRWYVGLQQGNPPHLIQHVIRIIDRNGHLSTSIHLCHQWLRWWLNP